MALKSRSPNIIEKYIGLPVVYQKFAMQRSIVGDEYYRVRR